MTKTTVMLDIYQIPHRASNPARQPDLSLRFQLIHLANLLLETAFSVKKKKKKKLGILEDPKTNTHFFVYKKVTGSESRLLRLDCSNVKNKEKEEVLEKV